MIQFSFMSPGRNPSFPASLQLDGKNDILPVFLQRFDGHRDSRIGFPVPAGPTAKPYRFIINQYCCLCHGFNDFTTNTVHQNFVNQVSFIVLIFA
jgi:hypothetical protein